MPGHRSPRSRLPVATPGRQLRVCSSRYWLPRHPGSCSGVCLPGRAGTRCRGDSQAGQSRSSPGTRTTGSNVVTTATTETVSFYLRRSSHQTEGLRGDKCVCIIRDRVFFALPPLFCRLPSFSPPRLALDPAVNRGGVDRWKDVVT